MSEEEQSFSPEQFPELPQGLSAVILPDLANRDEIYKELQPATKEKTLTRLNSFLQELNKQGADIVSILDIEVDMGKPPEGVMGNRIESKKFVIVRKKSG